MESEHVQQLFSWYRDFQDVPGKARVVDLAQVAGNDYNLNIPLYVEPVLEEQTLTVEEAVANQKEALQRAYAAEDQLQVLLKEAGLMS